MDIKKLKTAHREVAEMAECKEIFWTNPKSGNEKDLPFNMEDICEAQERLKRFAPYIAKAFPETEPSGGIIESELNEISGMKKELEKMCGSFGGRLFLKCDSHLPVSGSIKARGGIYEVLKFAEKVAMEAGMLKETDDYSILTEPRFRELFGRYSVAVGSTGNLGLSIGIISAKLGFKVTVHMSADARQWKKDLLRSKGVMVVEYPDDYQKAVAEGRKEAAADPFCHFVDDEASQDLFLGYSVAALRIGKQFEKLGITVDEEHPLFVYIPCGVGGAPGGVAFGLKEVYGENAHIFFAEPTHAPCMTMSMITGLKNEIAVSDIGLDGRTEADGLAVGRASVLVSDVMETLLDGCYTIEDKRLYPFLSRLADTENIFIEPSSCASFPGPSLVAADTKWLEAKGLADKMKNASHILWATGGSMVPEDEMKSYYERGK
ncbi:MAG: D-serine ammonia-lyase [Anaerovoracaceae bacterium]